MKGFGNKRVPKTKQDYKSAANEINAEFIGKLPRTVSEKTKWKCLTCSNEWEATYRNVFHKRSGCPKCAGNIRKTKTDYERIGLSRGISWCGGRTPKTANNKTDWKCNCGYKWSTTYGSISSGTGCPKCSGKAPKTKKDYNELADSIGYKFTGRVPNNVLDKTTWKCKRNHTWKVSYDAIRAGNRCPDCNDPSKGEQAVSAFLLNNKVHFETQKTFSGCRDKGLLKFDFYLPRSNLLIEYNGEQHYKPVKLFGGRKQLKDQQRRDKIKSDWAAANGITLLVIPYTDFDRIEQILSAYI